MANENMQKAKSHLEEAGKHAKDEAEDRMEDVKEGYQEAKGQAKAKISEAGEKLQHGCDKVKGYVKNNPLTALGIAAAIGVGIAALFNRNK